jgi:hypothetical protein
MSIERLPHKDYFLLINKVSEIKGRVFSLHVAYPWDALYSIIENIWEGCWFNVFITLLSVTLTSFARFVIYILK